MSKKSNNNIIVKRKSKGHGGGHHGGSWKIAYADFMTAMMAFFLVMWLLSTSSPEQRKQIADYFKSPENIAMANGDKNSLSSSVIPGGGDDMMKQDGEEYKHNDNVERYEMQALHDKIKDLIEVDPRLNDFKSNLLLRITESGLLIQIIDSQDRPMFKLGSKKPEEYMVNILQALVPIFNTIPNRLTLTGHTDSLPFANGEAGYSNWELSTDRANASRQVLVNGGLKVDKILQVIGMANNLGVGEIDPDSPANRRMTILVVSKNKEKQILMDDALIKEIAADEKAAPIQTQLKITTETSKDASE